MMEVSGSGTVQIMTDPYPDPGGPKSYRSYGSGCSTLAKSTGYIVDTERGKDRQMGLLKFKNEKPEIQG